MSFDIAQIREALTFAQGYPVKSKRYPDPAAALAALDSLEAKIERLRESEHQAQTYLDELRHIYEDQKREIERLKAQKAEAAEMWRVEIERLRKAGEDLVEWAGCRPELWRQYVARWREVTRSGVIQADKPFPDEQVIPGYGSSI